MNTVCKVLVKTSTAGANRASPLCCLDVLDFLERLVEDTEEKERPPATGVVVEMLGDGNVKGGGSSCCWLFVLSILSMEVDNEDKCEGLSGTGS